MVQKLLWCQLIFAPEMPNFKNLLHSFGGKVPDYEVSPRSVDKYIGVSNFYNTFHHLLRFDTKIAFLGITVPTSN